MASGFVKLPRTLLEVPWKKEPNTVAVWYHLLLSANHEARQLDNGLIVPRGATIISRTSLGAACGLKGSQTHTALEHLIKYAQIRTQIITLSPKGQQTQAPAQRCTLVYICNFDNYSGNAKGQHPSARPSANEVPAQEAAQEAATPKEIYREIYINVFGNNEGFWPAIEDWLNYKKGKRQGYKDGNSIAALFRKLQKLSNGNPATAREVVDNSMANNWDGLFAPSPTKPPKYNNTTPEAEEWKGNTFVNNF